MHSSILQNQLLMSDFHEIVTNPIAEHNKTGLQPVSRPVELVHYFGGWVEGASRQTD